MSFRSVIIAFFFVTGAGLAQNAPKLSFEVASVRQSPPMDMQKLVAEGQAGGRMPIGPRIGRAQAEYRYMSLTDLIAIAYKVDAAQIKGPDWLPATPWNIVAKMPEGSSVDEAPALLQALLEQRFKLRLHRETKDRPILALLVGRGKLKLEEAEPSKPLDRDAPLKPGELEVDEADGPSRMYTDKETGDMRIDRGVNGQYRMRMDQGSMVMHMEAAHMTMSGFADLLSQYARIGSGGRGVIDMTGLRGSYNLKFDFSVADLIAMMRAQLGAAAASEGAQPLPAATEPAGGSSLSDAVASLGLKLEPRKAPVEQLIIDHVEKTPVEN